MKPSRATDKAVAIVQSNYIPWKGYFDIINSVDEFVFLDDVQFTKRDWRNRNKIKTAQGLLWLTIPVVSKGRYEQLIDETEIAGPWAESHWTTLRLNYSRAVNFQTMARRIQDLYDAAAREVLLSKVNHIFAAGICAILGITTRLSWSRDYAASGTKTDRLLSICRAAGATSYLSGPSAAEYLDVGKFEAAGIRVSYFDYSGYPQYPQLNGPFEHGVSILDLLFNTGLDARAYMKSFV